MSKKLPEEEYLKIVELASEAERMLASGSLFNQVLTRLVKMYIQQLQAAPLYDLTARRAHAKLQALEEVKQDLQGFANNKKVVDARN